MRNLLVFLLMAFIFAFIASPPGKANSVSHEKTYKLSTSPGIAEISMESLHFSENSKACLYSQDVILITPKTLSANLFILELLTAPYDYGLNSFKVNNLNNKLPYNISNKGLFAGEKAPNKNSTAGGYKILKKPFYVNKK